MASETNPFDGLTIEAMIAYAAKMRPPTTGLPADPVKLRGVPPEQRDIVPLTADELRERGYVRQPEAIRRAEALVELDVSTITLIGPQGSGKSTVAAWLGSQAARRRHREGRDSLLFWTSWADLSAESRQGRPGQTSEAELYARSAPVVVLDDLGQERQHEDTRELVTRVVMHRFARRFRGLVTIVTTGLSSQQISARYGGGVLRRVGDPKAVELIDCRTPLRAVAGGGT